METPVKKRKFEVINSNNELNNKSGIKLSNFKLVDTGEEFKLFLEKNNLKFEELIKQTDIFY